MKIFLSIALLCIFLRQPALDYLTTTPKQRLNHWITTLNAPPIKIKLVTKHHNRCAVFIYIPSIFELLGYQLVSILLITILFLENN